ncbi:hypothetical protein KFZ56_12795 [Virgibacillus sp. NKC19-3]|uniref:YtzH-like family protein n=1 Tax=Virgibacillus saliphilus TaxID=2831674 RepID=UPI001C9AE754|nr:YtzH-like family protein [Virgibacillus sp. NKC19-3]MBY7143910.1 hypothetical protein [Virgibacillus sp. NKC19-3]
MALTINNQLLLLHDILEEQTTDSIGSVSEYQQIKRLVQKLTEDNRITDEQLLQLLPEIYNYGEQGEMNQHHSDHITTNKQNIENWLHAIQRTTLE